MSLEAGDRDPHVESPRVFAWPALKLSALATLHLLLVAVAVISIVVYLALEFYPDQTPPPPNEVERQAAALFGLPIQGSDSKIVGDLLVERFYALDAETGERYVADLLKGRIQGLQNLGTENFGPYIALLDLRNLQRDSALYAAFVGAVARPEGNYLGLRAFSGASDAFRLNFEGYLPERRLPFRGPEGEGPYEYLLAQKYDEVKLSPRMVRNEGHNYILNSTEQYPYFRSEFRTGRALLLSELIIVDATATNQRAKFIQLQTQYRPPAPR
jgi:hypothetical protein